jgi:hypothetical protein
MSDDLSRFFASKTGQGLLQDVHHIAEALAKLTLLAEHPLHVVETNAVPPSLPSYTEEIAQKHSELLQKEGAPPVQEGEQRTWWFPKVRISYIEAYSFRRADDGFYRFEAVLLGNGPDDIHSVTIVGDCDNDTYYFGANTKSALAHLLGHSDTPYLLSKGSAKKVFTAAQAAEDFRAFCESNASDLKKSIEKLQRDLETCQPENAADITEELAPLKADVEAWQALGSEVSYAIQNCAEGLGTLYDILESVLDAENRYERLCEFIPERCDCTWGYDYDSMTYSRSRQLRWFGLWLERQLATGGK